MSEPERISTLTSLDPSWLPTVAEWLRKCNSKGVAVMIYETLRTPERQDWLYASGRTRPGPIVTNAKAGQSSHQGGFAFDAVPWEVVLHQGEPVSKLDWDPFVAGRLDSRWSIMIAEAKKLGMEWAGDWRSFKEYVHFQMPNATMATDDLRA